MHDFATRLLAPGLPANERLGASSVPVFQTSTFDQRYEENAPFEYSRSGNPTRQALETVAADLEGGSQAFAFASGIAAVSASLLLFSPGDHILAARDIYGGTHRVLTRLCPRWGMRPATARRLWKPIFPPLCPTSRGACPGNSCRRC